jgi:hypothetical protein
MTRIDRLMLVVRNETKNNKLTPIHLSLYLALFFCWKESGYQNSFKISRKRVMVLARIHSSATYHKCIREMAEFGYIVYRPNYDHFTGSQIKLVF